MNHFVGIPLNFPVFSPFSHVFINIHEYLNLMCYELDHFGKHAVSKHSLKSGFAQFGHLTTEILVHPLDFVAISHSFLLFSLKFMTIHDKKIELYLMVKVQCLSGELALGLIH